MMRWYSSAFASGALEIGSKPETSGPCEAHFRVFYLRTDGAERRPPHWYRVCMARALARPCLSCSARRCRSRLVQPRAVPIGW